MCDYDVVVSGAGVGGLTLGAALGRQGLRVLIVDKQRQNIEIFKGELLQPRSLQIFETLGALTHLRTHGALPAYLFECRTAGGELIGALDYTLLNKPFNYVMLHYYSDIKAALAAATAEKVEIWFGARVSGLLRRSDGRVTGVRLACGGTEMRVTSALTVGADGRTSLIRREAGIFAKMLQYRHQLLAFDIHNAPDLEPRVTAFLTKQGIRALYPMPRNRARLYVQIRPGEFGHIRRQGIDDWIRSLVGSTAGLRHVAEPLLASSSQTQVMSAWRFSTPCLTVPGLALIGDAGHYVHPMAGQGMNAAIADAWTLSEAVREAIASHRTAPDLSVAIDTAVQRYDRVRLPQLEHIVKLSHRMAALLTGTSPLERAIAGRMLSSNRFNRRLQYLLTYNMSGLGFRPFSWWDRIYQFGIMRDPNAAQIRL